MADIVAKLLPDNSIELDREAATQIVEWLKSLSAADALKALQDLGDLARHEQYRQALGEAGAPEAAAARLDGPGAVLALRVIGNLAFDHPDNRAAAGKLGVVPRAVQLLTTAGNNVDQAKNAAGCLANLASESEGLQAEVASSGGIPALLGALCLPSPVPTMALRALSNLLESEPARAALIALPNSIASVIDATLIPVTNDLAGSGASFLASAAEQENLRPAFVAQKVTGRIITSFETTTDAEVGADLLKTLAYLSLTDETVPELFKALPMFLKLLSASHETVEPLLHTTMCVGNIARQEDRCVAIAKAGGVAILLALLKEGADARVAQLALGALRNVALAGENRTVVLESGGAKVASTFLSHRNAHVAYAAIGLVKTLTAGGEKFAAQVLREVDLTALVGAATPSDTRLVDGGERLTFEGARVLALLAERPEGAHEVAKVGGVPLLVRLLTCQWSTLQFEGARALLRLADAQELRSRVDAELIAALVALVSATKPKESGLPAAVLLERLSESESLRPSLAQPDIMEKLKQATVIEGQPPALVELLNRLILRLEAVPAAAVAAAAPPPAPAPSVVEEP